MLPLLSIDTPKESCNSSFQVKSIKMMIALIPHVMVLMIAMLVMALGIGIRRPNKVNKRNCNSVWFEKMSEP